MGKLNWIGSDKTKPKIEFYLVKNQTKNNTIFG